MEVLIKINYHKLFICCLKIPKLINYNYLKKLMKIHFSLSYPFNNLFII